MNNRWQTCAVRPVTCRLMRYRTGLTRLHTVRIDLCMVRWRPINVLVLTYDTVLSDSVCTFKPRVSKPSGSACSALVVIIASIHRPLNRQSAVLGTLRYVCQRNKNYRIMETMQMKNRKPFNFIFTYTLLP